MLGKECGFMGRRPRLLSHCKPSAGHSPWCVHIVNLGMRSRQILIASRECESAAGNPPHESHRLLHYSVLEALLISMSKRACKKGIACLVMESMWTEHYESNQQSKNNNRILRT